MTAAAFVVATTTGAAILAIWLDLRLPRLAPAGLVARFAALLAAGLLVQVSGTAFEAVLDSGLAGPLRALAALAVLLGGLTFAFVSGLWLLRSLLGAARQA